VSARIGVLVPALTEGGGVPSVARFVRDAVLRSGYELRLISLPTDSRDAHSVRLSRPATWLRGARTFVSSWEGHEYTHVGSVGSEIEPLRYRPRRALGEVVSDCDVLQVVCGSPAWANAVCGLGKPVAVQCATLAAVERRRRDGELRGIRGAWRRAMTRFTDRYDERALRRVDAIQVENPWMYDHARRLNAGRTVDIRYAPPGIDARLFSPDGVRPLGTDDYALCVGRLDDPRKNVRLLLAAYARLPQSARSGLRVVLAGHAAPPPEFWAEADALGVTGRIQFVHQPNIEQLVELYRRAAMFVLPSEEEGLGVALLEAMACGVAVVATRSGGPDGIITDGRDGFLVDLGDARTLSSRMQTLAADRELNRAIGLAARATIERTYAEEVAGNAFRDMWEALLARRRG
jgi:glycosyltransferase involved in cell wall biosynthesis